MPVPSRSLPVAALAAALAAAPAAAHADGPEAWEPYRSATLTLPAERYCGDFDLRSEPVRDGVERRVLSRYADGTVRSDEYKGELVVELTNLATGESARADLSGHAAVTYRPDGSLATYEMNGPVGMGWPGGDEYLDAGFYLMNGYHVVEFAPDGSRSMRVDRGVESDLCDRVS